MRGQPRDRDIHDLPSELLSDRLPEKARPEWFQWSFGTCVKEYKYMPHSMWEGYHKKQYRGSPTTSPTPSDSTDLVPSFPDRKLVPVDRKRDPKVILNMRPIVESIVGFRLRDTDLITIATFVAQSYHQICSAKARIAFVSRPDHEGKQKFRPVRAYAANSLWWMYSRLEAAINSQVRCEPSNDLAVIDPGSFNDFAVVTYLRETDFVAFFMSRHLVWIIVQYCAPI
jgi:hypothetical protein